MPDIIDAWLLPAVGTAAALATWGLLFPIRRILISRKVLDLPNPRSSHDRPIPRGGGLAVVGVALVAVAGWAAASKGGFGAPLLAYLGGALLVAGMSWVDDLRSLPSWLRLAGQAVAAAGVVWACGPLRKVMLPWGEMDLGVLAVPVTLFWVVGLTNAYNFMDGIDGLAGAQALTAGLGWAVLGWLLGLPLISLAGAAIAGSSLGFLVHNWHPARIFMGDVGSSFLGYTFAALPLLGGGSPALPVAAALLVWPFLFDASFTLLRRLARRENVFQAHRSHLYQRLVIAGCSHSFVASLYLGIGAAACGLVLLLPRWALVAPGVGLLSLGLWAFVLLREKRPAPPARPARR